jgi:restriction system protein
MDRKTKDGIVRNIERLESTSSPVHPREAETILAEVLSPLLAEDNYSVTSVSGPGDHGLDLIARKPPSAEYQENSIGILQKHYRHGSSIGPQVIRELLGAALLQGLNRAMLVINTEFTLASREIIRRTLPVRLELLDIDALKAWVARIEIDSSIDQLEITEILKAVSRRFAQLIAEDSHNLEKLEWRDIERTLAEVFDGLGFSVELTPGSKDGGKDIILECVVTGERHTYIVEIKHWRSGSRVGQPFIQDFLNVIVRERRQGGLFLSTYGYCDNAFEMLSEIERQKLKFGSEEKVVSLCKTYVKADAGIWSPPESLAEILFEETV